MMLTRCHGNERFWLNTLRPRQNGRRFADDTFKRIFLNENTIISIMVSHEFVPKGAMNNNPALVQIMAWHRSGDKPLPEPMVVSLLTHICVTRPQWVNPSQTVQLSVLFASIQGSLQWHDMNFIKSHIIRLSTVCLTASADPHQRNIKVCLTGALWGEFIGDRWIPRTKGQEGGKSFPMMTSSWLVRFRRRLLRWPLKVRSRIYTGPKCGYRSACRCPSTYGARPSAGIALITHSLICFHQSFFNFHPY